MNQKKVVDYATVQFRFKGGNTFDPLPPDNIVSFTYEDIATTGCNRFTCELFDSTWHTIENLIIEKKGEIEFRFGWSYSGRLSEWQSASILTQAPTFEIHGLRIAMEGLGTIITANDEAKTRDWSDKRYLGKIHEIVKAIAEEQNWEHDITETALKLSEEGEPRIFVQTQLPDLSFIKTILLPEAITTDGRGDFRCCYNASENKLYFGLPKFENPAVQTYTVYKDYMGQVISFTPDLGDGSLQRDTGALNMRMVGMDPFKKKLYDVVVDNKASTKNKVLLGQFIPDQQIKTKGGAGRFLRSPVHTEGSAAAIARQTWEKRYNLIFQAELEIIGDPTLRPGTNIGVLALDSNNQPFYFSGKYSILKIQHTISDGNYTTRLSLIKNAMREGTINAEAEQYGDIKAVIEELERMKEEGLLGVAYYF